MTDIARSAPARFLLRLPSGLHASLHEAAGRAGLSLNEYCVRALSAPGAAPVGPAAAATKRAFEMFGADLIGVVVYGSWARGEATAASDVDVLIVLKPSIAIDRDLYRRWDERPLTDAGHQIEPRFVTIPPTTAGPHGLWLEAALDGVLVLDTDHRLARYLSALRRSIASGAAIRRQVHGQPYWTTAA